MGHRKRDRKEEVWGYTARDPCGDSSKESRYLAQDLPPDFICVINQRRVTLDDEGLETARGSTHTPEEDFGSRSPVTGDGVNLR
uniref:Uncharacterized protein n=1 Tax=Steinernema glaseri TaxID=37863 RepID=A0A1I7ZVT7_9BILA